MDASCKPLRELVAWKLHTKAGDKMEIQPGIKSWWWWWSQFSRSNKPLGAPALYTHINSYTLLILNPKTGSQRITQYYTDGSSNLHVLLHQRRLILWSSYPERQSYWFFLNEETETISAFFFFFFWHNVYFRDTYKGTLRTGEGEKKEWRQRQRDKTFAKSFQAAVDLWSCLSIQTNWQELRKEHARYLTFLGSFHHVPSLHRAQTHTNKHPQMQILPLWSSNKFANTSTLPLIAISLRQYTRKCRNGIGSLVASQVEMASHPHLIWLENIPPHIDAFCKIALRDE